MTYRLPCKLCHFHSVGYPNALIFLPLHSRDCAILSQLMIDRDKVGLTPHPCKGNFGEVRPRVLRWLRGQRGTASVLPLMDDGVPSTFFLHWLGT